MKQYDPCKLPPIQKRLFQVLEGKEKEKEKEKKNTMFVYVDDPVTRVGAYFRPISPRPTLKPQFLFTHTIPKKLPPLPVGKNPYLPRNPKTVRSFCLRMMTTEMETKPLKISPILFPIPKPPFH
jgi:hypothetical protein